MTDIFYIFLSDFFMDACFLPFVYIYFATFVGGEENGFRCEEIKPDCLLSQPDLLSLCKLSSEYVL